MGLIRSGCIKKNFFLRDYFIGGAVFLHHRNKCYLPGSLCIVNDIGAQWQDQCFSTVFFTVPHPQSLLDIIFLIIPSPWKTVFCQTWKASMSSDVFQPHTLFPLLLWFWWHKRQVFFVVLVFWVCYFFLQPFFSLFEGWIISTEVPSSSFFSLSSPSCHWIFGDSFKFWLFYFSVTQFPFGSYL